MWTITKTAVAGGAVLITLALALVVKTHYFPAVKEAYFTPEADKLRQVPAGLAVVRPTHFARSLSKIRHVHDEDSLTRTLGRNVQLRMVLAEAYDCSPGQVVLPPNAPKGNYDFLVTTSSGGARKNLRSAIQQTLGYTAHRETRDTDVLRLKVANAGLPGMAVSPGTEDDDITYQAGKLCFQREQMDDLIKRLQPGLKELVVDETGLTNFYDFSVGWDLNRQMAAQNGTMNAEDAQKILNGTGLKLEPDTASVEMLIVEKTR